MWLESDSTTVVIALNQGTRPWKLQHRWNNTKDQMRSLFISYVWKEANFTRDKVYKMGTTIIACDEKCHLGIYRLVEDNGYTKVESIRKTGMHIVIVVLEQLACELMVGIFIILGWYIYLNGLVVD